MGNLSVAEVKKLEKQFRGRQITMLLSSVLIIFIGIIFLLLGVAAENIAGNNITFITSGVALIGLGAWGISLSKRQKFQIPCAEILVYETRKRLTAAWCFYLIGIFGMVVTFGDGCDGGEFSWLFSIFSLMILFFVMFMFSDYRKRIITVSGDTVWGVNAWGRPYTFQKSDIGRISLCSIGGSYLIQDREGKKMLRFESNMVHAIELYCRLEVDKYVSWYEPSLLKRQQAERLEWNPGDETWQTNHIKEIKRAFQILVSVNSILTFGLLIWLKTFIQLKYRLFLVELQPLSYAVYACIFNETAIWQPMGDMNASGDWKKKHFSMTPAYVHTGVIFLFLTAGVMEEQVNIIRGEGKYLFCVFLLCVILSVITSMRIRTQKSKGTALLCAVLFSLTLSLGIVPGALMASIRQNVHYPAEIVSVHFDRGAGRRVGSSYRAAVILSDGSQTSVDISKYNYDDIQEGKEKVVCESEGMFGIRFVTIHDPVKKDDDQIILKR